MKVQTIWVADNIAVPTHTHAHDFYQMIYCEAPDGYFEISGKRYEAVKDAVYFIQPMQLHGFWCGKGMKLMDFKFVVEDKEFGAELSSLPSVFIPKDLRPFKSSMLDVIAEAKSSSLYRSEATNAALEMMLIRLLRTYTEERKGDERAAPELIPQVIIDKKSSLDVRLAQLVHWIELRMGDDITLDDMNELMFLNKSYLVSSFSKMYGMPPMKYLNWVRLERAKKLIASTDMSITTIAEMTGFKTIHYFSRYFKNKEGMTPQEYRKEAKQNPI